MALDAGRGVRDVGAGIAAVARKGGAFATEVFHLWHPEAPRALEAENRRRVEARVASGLTRAEVGLSAHPGPGAQVQVLVGA